MAVLLVASWGSGGIAHAQTKSAPQTAPRRPGRDLALYTAQYRELRDKFAKDLESLAKECEAKGLTEPAAIVRATESRPRKEGLEVRSLPRTVRSELPVDLSADERFWQAQLRHETSSYARQLYLLARQCLTNGHVTLAWELVRETAEYDPDHLPARKALGYVRSGDEWVSPFEASMFKRGRVRHPVFGWLPKDHVPRYEKGERNFNGHWMSVVKEAGLRSDFTKGWEVRTDHFRVKTNHSLERGVEIANRLEDFHALFFQVLAGFFTTREQARQLVEGTSRPPPVPEPLDVFYFRSRDEYVNHLRTKTDQPVEITNGMYFPSTGIAYYFFDPEAVDADATLYHEATHQILSGVRPGADQIGVNSDFWVVEGIACYMESFTREERDGTVRFSLGRTDHKRLQAARANLLNENYFLPLAELAAMGMREFQTHAEIRKNYSESAAYTHFFMHHDNGRLREALVEHLSQIYAQRRSTPPESLPELTGMKSSELDELYREHVRELGGR